MKYRRQEREWGASMCLLTRDLHEAHKTRPSLSHFICHPIVISCLLETEVPPDRKTKNIPDVVFQVIKEIVFQEPF